MPEGFLNIRKRKSVNLAKKQWKCCKHYVQWPMIFPMKNNGMIFIPDLLT